VAERYGQLPDTVEREMSEYYFNATLDLMAGEAIHEEKTLAQMKKAKR
jgi:hypothetical protein